MSVPHEANGRVAAFDASAPEVRVIQVVETRLRRLGKGTAEDPFRELRQYWSLDGELLAEVDTWQR